MLRTIYFQGKVLGLSLGHHNDPHEVKMLHTSKKVLCSATTYLRVEIINKKLPVLFFVLKVSVQNQDAVSCVRKVVRDEPPCPCPATYTHTV